MRIAVWGAGEVGTALAYRLTTSPHVSELHWINKRPSRIQSRVVDIEHGLTFAPACHRVVPYGQADAGLAVERVDLVVLTQGVPVQNGDRAALWPLNRDVLRESAIPALRSQDVLVLVVSNPVDCLTSLIHDEAAVHDPDRRVIGLGTTVETARLRASLADSLMAAARELPIYAVGTHDADFVPVWSSLGGLGRLVRESVLDAARKEVCNGPRRIRDQERQITPPCRSCGEPRPRSTRHPIVEAAVSVIEAIGSDARRVLTVSTYDPDRRLCWSVPCTLGRSGVMKRHIEWLDDDSWEKLEGAFEALRRTMSGRASA